MIRWVERTASLDLLCGWEGGRPWGFGKGAFLTVWMILCPGPHRASSASRAAPPLSLVKLVLPCLEASNNFIQDSNAAKVTLLMPCSSYLSFFNLSLQLGPSLLQANKYKVWLERRGLAKKDLQDIDNLPKGTLSIKTKGPRSGRNDFKRYLFSQLLGMLAAENSHLNPLVKVVFCWRASLEQPTSKDWSVQGHKHLAPSLKSGQA